MSRILLIGKDGQIGWELCRTVAPLAQVMAVGRKEMDLSRADSIRRTVREFQPRVIINAAAYTKVDQAETETEMARMVNAVAPAIIAEEARRIDAALIHYSTDYVFDGEKREPYLENDEPHPINVYGETKLAGERAIQAIALRYLILRTSWVYGWRGGNFMLTVLRLAKEREELRIVGDQIGAPTWSRMIAEATAHLASRLCAPENMQASEPGELYGIFHLTAAGETSWFGFASAIIDLCKVNAQLQQSYLMTEGLVAKRVVPIQTSKYPTPAARPKYSVLSKQKLAQTFSLELPNWRAQLELCFGR